MHVIVIRQLYVQPHSFLCARKASIYRESCILEHHIITIYQDTKQLHKPRTVQLDYHHRNLIATVYNNGQLRKTHHNVHQRLAAEYKMVVIHMTFPSES